jgi:hypothetical protein
MKLFILICLVSFATADLIDLIDLLLEEAVAGKCEAKKHRSSAYCTGNNLNLIGQFSGSVEACAALVEQKCPYKDMFNYRSNLCECSDKCYRINRSGMGTSVYALNCLSQDNCECEGGNGHGQICLPQGKTWDSDGNWCYLKGGLAASACSGATKSVTSNRYWSKHPCLSIAKPSTVTTVSTVPCSATAVDNEGGTHANVVPFKIKNKDVWVFQIHQGGWYKLTATDRAGTKLENRYTNTKLKHSNLKRAWDAAHKGGAYNVKDLKFCSEGSSPSQSGSTPSQSGSTPSQSGCSSSAPSYSQLKTGGRDCPNNDDKRCLNNNTCYRRLSNAWDQCGKVQGCGYIMKYYGCLHLRRASDPVNNKDRMMKQIRYSC